MMPNNKILLITPPYERIAPGYEFVKQITNNAPSLGLLHLAAEVRQHGYRPSIIESDIFGLTVDEVVQQAIELNPAYVGITMFTVGVWTAAEIARKIKSSLPDTIIIVGGPHISSMALETMERFMEFDLAVVGEGEEILVLLLDALRSGDDIADVPGIVFRERGDIQLKLRKNPGLPIKKDLDYLPMPAWDLLPNFPAAYAPAVYDFPRQPVASIAASRGCPFHCKFCDTSTFGASVRAYSPERLVHMINYLQDTYGIRHIMFVDDLFVASRQRVTRLCNLIIDNNIDITWSCASRVDVVKPDLLKLMKRAGCWEMSFGLESGSDEQLKRMDKAASIDKSVQALNWAHDAGIRTKGLFMLGYPGENEDTIKATMEFIHSVPLTIMNMTKFTPYPGSPIYQDIYNTNIRDDHWEKMNGMNFLWAPEGMTIAELNRHYRKILVSFYSSPRIAGYYTRFSLRYPAHLRRLLKFLWQMTIAKSRALFKTEKPIAARQTRMATTQQAKEPL
jgi:anaerobic magnesium-protoporphyrin IX monomethyl ester cyclase